MGEKKRLWSLQKFGYFLLNEGFEACDRMADELKYAANRKWPCSKDRGLYHS